MAATAADGNSNDAEKSTTRMITLISSDGKHFEIPEEVAGMSQTLAHMIEDGCVESGIPLPNVTSTILVKVIEYCSKHVSETAKSGDNDTAGGQVDLKSFDAGFIKVDQPTLFNIILAANYLDIKGLLDLACQTVTDMIKGKTVEEIRRIFNIINDLTPEEAEIRHENAWAFE